MALAKNDDDHKFLKFYIDKATGYRSDIGDDVLKGVAEGEDFVLSNETSSPYYRKGIYVFSETLADESYTDIDLSLGYPADKFLMANRCYVEATSKSQNTVTHGKAFTFCFDDGTATASGTYRPAGTVPTFITICREGELCILQKAFISLTERKLSSNEKNIYHSRVSLL